MLKLLLAALAALLLCGVALAGSQAKPKHPIALIAIGGRGVVGPVCADRSNGLMHFVRLPQTCHSGQQRLYWRLKLRSGIRGPRGFRGPAGVAGAQGPTGPQGVPGTPGGPRGATGPAGATGAQGPTGARGATGSIAGSGVLLVCVSNGGSLQLDVNGQPCDNQGHMPIKLVTAP